MDDRNPKFRAMLVRINNKLQSSELKTLIYYAEIKRKLAETIHQPTDLFQILEERLDLKPNNLRYFRKMIADTLDTRKDLLKIIDEYVRENEMCSVCQPQQDYSGSQPLNRDSVTTCMCCCQEERMIIFRPCNHVCCGLNFLPRFKKSWWFSFRKYYFTISMRGFTVS